MNDEMPGAEEKRQSPRYRIDLRSSVLVTAVKIADEAEYVVLQGQLLDVSLSGLALVVSEEDIAELNKLGADIRLQLLLPLPGEAIAVEAMPMRYQKLAATEKSQVLIGAQITNMSGRDRIVFINFIHGL